MKKISARVHELEATRCDVEMRLFDAQRAAVSQSTLAESSEAARLRLLESIAETTSDVRIAEARIEGLEDKVAELERDRAQLAESCRAANEGAVRADARKIELEAQLKVALAKIAANDREKSFLVDSAVSEKVIEGDARATELQSSLTMTKLKVDEWERRGRLYEDQLRLASTERAQLFERLHDAIDLRGGDVRRQRGGQFSIVSLRTVHGMLL